MRGIGGRIDADHGVAAAQEQSVEHRRGDTARVVGRMVGLQPRGKCAAGPDRGAKRRGHLHGRRDGDQILVAHDLAGGRRHFGCQTRCDRGDAFGAVVAGGGLQQPVPESSHRQMRYRRKGLAVMAVEDQPGDFVGLVRNDLLFQEGVQRQVGEDPCGRGTFGVVLGCASGQLVTRAKRCGLRHQLDKSVEGVVDTRNLLTVCHFSSLSASASMANSSSGELATRG